MNRTQRLAFLGIAAVIAVVAIFVLADSSEDDNDGQPSSATATATPEATETQSAQEEETATPEPTREAVPLLTGDKVTDIEVTQGDTVRFRVRSDAPEEVHVHGYDLMTEVEPGKTARMEFQADITGIFEIEFEDSGKQIAELKVNPG
jgi:FtsP/CotA-like multicopper oxidase with cupredoxin domain